ncbi:MAG: hypothetical protein ABSG54_10455 [Terriglobia bacterium]|jgi:hypothetical protein
MSAISYFQRFSQKENHVTNNTLLVLRHVYRSSPRKVSLLLNSLLEEEVPVGLEFRQQVRGTHSVPDALISQQPLSVFIEAKLGDALDTAQIERHLKSIKNREHSKGSAILIGLTTQRIERDIENLKKKAKADGIRLFVITYSDLAMELRKLCADHEQDLIEIVEDYQAFLAAEGLLSHVYDRMVVFPTGTSWRENVPHGLYYEPAGRSPKWNCRFLGIYHNKRVSHVGRIETVTVCRFEGGKVVVEGSELGELNDAQQSRIRQIIDDTDYYDLKDGESLRYYLVDKFVETRFIKVSPGGMRGHRFFDLSEYVGTLNLGAATTMELAAALKGKTFD